MKRNNIIYKSLIIGLLTCGAVSCSKDFVDLDNPQSLPLQGTIKDLTPCPPMPEVTLV